MRWRSPHSNDSPRDLAQPVVVDSAGSVSRTRQQVVATVPGGWDVKESWTLLAPDGQANIIASVEPLVPGVDTARYATLQGDLLRDEFPMFHEIRFVPHGIGHRHGYLREFTWQPPDGVPVQQLQLYYVENGRGFTATATTPVASINYYHGLFEDVLSTLGFFVDQ